MDENNDPIPFANIYFKETGLGTTTDVHGEFYYRFKDPGYYEVVFTAVGYKIQEIKITIEEKAEVSKNIYLSQDVEVIKKAVIDAKRRDPAYAIIADAIDEKPRWKKQLDRYSCDVYIKASEIISEKEKKKRETAKKEAKKQKENNDKDVEETVFEKEKREREEAINKLANAMNMVEIEMRRHFEYPGKIKEIRSAYKKLGDTYGLYYINTAEDDFNFYDNLMGLYDLNELPLISPLHVTSILTYKFKLVETTYIEGKKVFNIQVTPRKKGNASWTGNIWIQDVDFCIRKVDLYLHKGGMIIYDDFNIKQEYRVVSDSIVLLDKQEFDYTSKTGSNNFKGHTYVEYTNYDLDPIFEKNYFKNELAVTTKEAYEKDSTYWSQNRPIPLTAEEQRFQFVKDSIETVHTSDEYLDSLDRESNQVKPLDVLWFGIDHINRKEKKAWYIFPLAAMLNPFSIGGMRVGEGTAFFKGWENEKWIASDAYLSMGLRNNDVKGNVSFSYFHDPMKQGRISILGAKRFNVVAQNDAITNILQRSNWIEENVGQINYSRELFNGFYIDPYVKYVQRQSIDGYEFNPRADDLFDNNVPDTFDPYDAFITGAFISYTPFQKYMTEPYRKVVLGSKWPTISAQLETGIHGVFGSEVQYTYLEGVIRQDFKLGTAGTSTYKVKSGTFLNTNLLRYQDSKIFPRGDRFLFASAMESMQLQDTTLTSTEFYLQAHYMHHFNGALVNYIPYIKKLGFHFSGGVSGLYIKDSNYRYGEVFFGIERGFKILRYRYRVGLYFVMAESNTTNIKPGLKIAINQYNVRTKSWGN